MSGGARECACQYTENNNKTNRHRHIHRHRHTYTHCFRVEKDVGLSAFVHEELLESFESSEKKCRKALVAELKKITALAEQVCSSSNL